MEYLQPSFVYIIYAPDGRVYVGKTNDMKRRYGEYKRGAVSKQPALMESFVTYGFDSHSFGMLFEGMATKEELKILERVYIRKYDSENHFKGLNSTKMNQRFNSKY